MVVFHSSVSLPEATSSFLRFFGHPHVITSPHLPGEVLQHMAMVPVVVLRWHAGGPSW